MSTGVRGVDLHRIGEFAPRSGPADSLAGRIARLGMFGLSRGEAMGVADDFVAVVAAPSDEMTVPPYS